MRIACKKTKESVIYNIDKVILKDEILFLEIKDESVPYISITSDILNFSTFKFYQDLLKNGFLDLSNYKLKLEEGYIPKIEVKQ